MRFKFQFVVITLLLCFSFTNVYAHPGRTDSNGCHTCRTNCSSWGLSDGQYHCHNGGSSSSSSSSSSSTSRSVVNYVYGCTDSNAYNYNSDANRDDGSCIAKVYGCMNSEAINYNSEVNTGDGSCLFNKEETTYKKIKYKTKYKLNKNKKEGSIIKKGKNGKKKIITQITTNENGEVVETKIISSETMKKAVNKVVSTKKKSKVKKRSN